VRCWLCVILILVFRLMQAEPLGVASLRTTHPVPRKGYCGWKSAFPKAKSLLHFLLDSGASASVVNLGTARRLGLELGRKVSVTAVATTLSGHWPSEVIRQGEPD